MSLFSENDKVQRNKNIGITAFIFHVISFFSFYVFKMGVLKLFVPYHSLYCRFLTTTDSEFSALKLNLNEKSTVAMNTLSGEYHTYEYESWSFFNVNIFL